MKTARRSASGLLALVCTSLLCTAFALTVEQSSSANELSTHGVLPNELPIGEQSSSASEHSTNGVLPNELPIGEQSSSASEQSTNNVLPNWAQCGGLSGSCGQPGNGPCQDAVWSSPVCPSGYSCQKQSQWYYQCLPNEQSSTAATEQSNANTETSTGNNGVLPNWAQCGGLSGTCGMSGQGPCQDAVWSSPVCPTGYSCQKQSEWYYQCLPGGETFSPSPSGETSTGGLTTLPPPESSGVASPANEMSSGAVPQESSAVVPQESSAAAAPAMQEMSSSTMNTSGRRLLA